MASAYSSFVSLLKRLFEAIYLFPICVTHKQVTNIFDFRTSSKWLRFGGNECFESSQKIQASVMRGSTIQNDADAIFFVQRVSLRFVHNLTE